MSHRIKELIKEKGYTQQEFADKLGITRIGLSQLVNGKPSYTTLEKIASVLEVPLWRLFATPDEINENNLVALVEYRGVFSKATNFEELEAIVDNIRKQIKQPVD